ncbi:hypothetical protein N9902_03470, partial [Akkermansiaceae bacterium]|nr:hypothetical protein [Akkermansiaceae bacterium]
IFLSSLNLPSFLMKFLIIGSLLAASTQLHTATLGSEATSVPESSAAILGGICGIISLLWHRMS